MRAGTLVAIAYVMCVIVASVWRFFPIGRDAIPDVGALTAAYLGLTARGSIAPAVGGSVVLGYLVDLISGGPPGLMALVLGLTGVVARAVQQRILVRGAAMTIGFSAFVAVVSGVLAIAVRVTYGMPTASPFVEVQHVCYAAVSTALVGAIVWRVFRRVDAAFARTHRERDAALEGLVP